LFRGERPAIVHGYLGLSNTLATVMRPLHGGTVVWGARASDVDTTRYDRLARLDDWIERKLARRPRLIIANSFAGRRHLIDRGFPDGSIAVIHNGIDVERFRPDAEARSRVRAELGLADGELAIGRIGRIDPQKDYPTFLRAAALVARSAPRCRFVCVGYDPHGLRSGFEELARDLGVAERVSWLGQRRDMAAVYNALDLNVSSSAWGEGTPNAIAEGMACGVPAVVTDSGDSAWTVGQTGLVTPKGDPEALARAILAMLERIRRGEADRAAIRARIVDTMSLDSLAQRTEAALTEAIAGGVR
jgi:glycosyltransferase involved in cell wall biosynthesis